MEAAEAVHGGRCQLATADGRPVDGVMQTPEKRKTTFGLKGLLPGFPPFVTRHDNADSLCPPVDTTGLKLRAFLYRLPSKPPHISTAVHPSSGKETATAHGRRRDPFSQRAVLPRRRDKDHPPYTIQQQKNERTTQTLRRRQPLCWAASSRGGP